MLLRKFGIAPRSIVFFTAVALLVVILGLFSLARMENIRASTEDMMENKLPSYALLGSMQENVLRLRIVSFRLLVDRDPQDLQVTVARGAELAGILQGEKDAYQALISSPEEREAFERFDRQLSHYYEINDRLLRLSEQDRVGEMQQLLKGEYKDSSDTLAKLLGALVKANREQARASGAAATANYDHSVRVVWAVMLLAAALTVALAVLLTRSIVQPLRQAVGVAQTIASGDLSKPVSVVGADEPAQLLHALRGMQSQLRETIESIAQSSDQLASASEELNVVTEDSARGLVQQNDELEQAATAVNEMTTAVDEVARNAVSTAEASQASDRTARRGQEQVDHTVESITTLAGDVRGTSDQVRSLAEKVHEISKVLDVIRSIAEQTNLLALNAAIEAARAGDAGRGFAVVADEVRALAHRTQQSTHEIEQMIGGIQQGTEQAMTSMQASTERAAATLRLAEAAGEALKEITAAISQISERNLVIASASEEQAQVAREVDRNLVNIRDLAVQTSTGANQTSAASQDLSRLAVNLNTLVGRFQL
ncbi:methyl-accepting chemotaxis protein [Stutzerimonas azotifigens]|uniref:methyl-accepting chemotaxis protein n=1 Tax=Stutzerimonas azotifigens TaxID=291995 RepID=UPI00042014CC|nr:methyl-accepting chemotaxis protein [Stutzerimonas azotifigens]